MAHELASAFQQAIGIGNLGASKKTDIDVSREGIDVAECRVAYAGGRMAIMQQLSHVISAVAHGFKPALRYGSQFIRMLQHPGVDRWISLDRTGERQDLIRWRFHFDADGWYTTLKRSQATSIVSLNSRPAVAHSRVKYRLWASCQNDKE